MKLSEKIVELLKKNETVFQIERKQSGRITDLGFLEGTDRETCIYNSPDGLVNMYGLYVELNWHLDVYSLEECSDEEILFIKLAEPELNMKTHSEVLNIVTELIG